jgi:dipeptidyl aminopeptidase/acylaminoacyl peptidase
VDWFGPTDLSKLGKSVSDPKSATAQLLGGPVSENPEKAAKANPITYIGKDVPPFLIMHGTKDPLVPYSQSELLVDALKKAGADVTLVPIEGAGHGGPAFSTPQVRRQIQEFFDKHLKSAKAQK